MAHILYFASLAETLERIARRGPQGFYEGRTAALIAADMKNGGGLVDDDQRRLRRPLDGLDQLGANGPIDPIEWELFDLSKDPNELNSVHGLPAYGEIQDKLEKELVRLREEFDLLQEAVLKT